MSKSNAFKAALQMGEMLSDLDLGVMSEPKKTKAIGVKKWVHPSKLVPNKHNFYDMTRDDGYLELLHNMTIDGFDEDSPIQVKPEDENGNYEIISGHRRRMAALELGLEKVRISIKPNEDTEDEGIARVARANTGVRQKKIYNTALQLKCYLTALDKKEDLSKAEKKDLAMERFSIRNEKVFYNTFNLSTLPEKVLIWGQNEYLTRDEGLAIYNGYKKEEYQRITDNLLDALEAIIESDDEKENKVTQVKARMKAYETSLKKKDNVIEEKQKTEKKVTLKSYVKKLDKLWSDDMVFPTAPKERERAKETIEKTIERLMQLKEQL